MAVDLARGDLSSRFSLQQALALLGFACVSAPAVAIPSPDLLVNLTASAGQVLGLLSVVLGGFAYSARKKARAHNERRRAWRWAFRLLLAGFTVSVAVNVFQYTDRLDDKQQRFQHTVEDPIE